MYCYFYIFVVALILFQNVGNAEAPELGKCFLAEFLGVTANEHDSRRSSTRSSAADSSQAKINEVLADIEYYNARIRSVELLIAKEKVTQRYQVLQLKRHEKLVAANSISQEEWENTQERSEQIALNLIFLESVRNERKAELKGAEARLDQLQ